MWHLRGCDLQKMRENYRLSMQCAENEVNKLVDKGF
jgi:hypothetical protein